MVVVVVVLDLKEMLGNATTTRTTQGRKYPKNDSPGNTEEEMMEWLGGVPTFRNASVELGGPASHVGHGSEILGYWV